jgi:hypothetical protein
LCRRSWRGADQSRLCGGRGRDLRQSRFVQLVAAIDAL